MMMKGSVPSSSHERKAAAHLVQARWGCAAMRSPERAAVIVDVKLRPRPAWPR